MASERIELSEQMPTLDVQVRADFPFLQAQSAPFHYLDNAATTQKPQVVIDAISTCYQSGYAPIHRGLYPQAEQASLAYERARQTVADFIHAPRPEQLVFVRSCTESINMVAQGWARPRLQAGDRLWVTRMEHHANFLPWQRVCEQTGAVLHILELDEQGQLIISADELFHPRSKLLAVTQVSNVLGLENPVARLCADAHRHGITVLVDGAQAVGHQPVDVAVMDCDFYAFSAHKLYGPAGIGALYAKPECLAAMQPLLVGGGMVDWVDDQHAGWCEVPARFEGGSPDLPGAVGFAAAVNYLQQLGMERVQAHGQALCRYAAECLQSLPGVRVFAGGHSGVSSLLSFELDEVHPHDLAQIAGERGVALRAGHHCCQPLMRHLGVAATNRLSVGLYSSRADVDALLVSIDYARTLMQAGD